MEDRIAAREGYFYCNKFTLHFYEITREIINRNTGRGRIDTRTEGIMVIYNGNPFNLTFIGQTRYIKRYEK